MIIEKEVSRIIISDYTTTDKKRLRFGITNLFRFGKTKIESYGENTKEDILDNGYDILPLIENVDYLSESEKSQLKKVLSLEEFQFFYEIDDKIYFPVGVFDDVKRMFPQARVKERKGWDAKNIQWYPEKLPDPRNDLQKDAIQFMYSNSSYIAATLRPGTGKTFMSTYVAFRLGKKTLIVVPTTNLKKQWKESLQGLFKVPDDRIGFIEKKEDLLQNKDWLIVLQQTVMSLNKDNDLEEYLKNSGVGTKIIDEAHMFFVNTMKISCIANFQNNIHLTATFGRSGEAENTLFYRAFGGIAKFDNDKKKWTGSEKYPSKKHAHLYSYNLNSGISKGTLKSITSFKYGLMAMKYANILFPESGMTKFERDILDIIKQVLDGMKYGRALILFPTIIAVEKMTGIISDMYPKKMVRALNSRHSKQENDKTTSEADIIVSTSKSSGTGLDLKGLSVCITAEQYKSWILAEQIFGRLRERPDGKDTYFYDVTDLASKQLVKWRNARLDVMRKRCKSFHMIKGTKVTPMTEEFEYLQAMYQIYIENGEYDEAMNTVNELMFYI